MTLDIHPSWQSALAPEFEKLYWNDLMIFIKSEYGQQVCFPQENDIFKAFDLAHFDDVRVVILGQDPYHTAYTPSTSGTKGSVQSDTKESRFLYTQESQEPGLLRISQWQEQQVWQQPVCAAMGLAFSVPNGSRAQPSLRNIFKELESDIWVQRTQTDLTDWAEQWVLLLNAVLTVRQWEPASHQKQWWENFTDATIRSLSEQREGIVFILWGNSAIEKQSLIDTSKHHIIVSPHPSPFSSYRGFFGSRPFSRTNTYLREQGKQEINW